MKYTIFTYIFLILIVLCLYFILYSVYTCKIYKKEHFADTIARNGTLVIDVFGNIILSMDGLRFNNLTSIILSSKYDINKKPYTLSMKSDYMLLLKNNKDEVINTIILENYNENISSTDIYNYKFKFYENGEMAILSNNNDIPLGKIIPIKKITPNLLYKLSLEGNILKIYNYYGILTYSFTISNL